MFSFAEKKRKKKEKKLAKPTNTYDYYQQTKRWNNNLNFVISWFFLFYLDLSVRLFLNFICGNPIKSWDYCAKLFITNPPSLCQSHTLSLVAITDFNNILKTEETISKTQKEAIAKCKILWRAVYNCKSYEINDQFVVGRLVYWYGTKKVCEKHYVGKITKCSWSWSIKYIEMKC